MKDVTAILVAGDNQFSFELRKIWKNFTMKKKIMENGCSMKTHFFFQGVSHPIISVDVTLGLIHVFGRLDNHPRNMKSKQRNSELSPEEGTWFLIMTHFFLYFFYEYHLYDLKPFW